MINGTEMDMKIESEFLMKRMDHGWIGSRVVNSALAMNPFIDIVGRLPPIWRLRVVCRLRQRADDSVYHR